MWFYNPQNWFHVKSEWQKNHEISTLWIRHCLNLGHCNLPKSQELEVLQLVTVEVAGHVDAFTPYDYDFVAVQDELGDNGGQTADQMATAVDNYWLKK